MARTLTITPDGQVRINDWPGDGRLLQHLYAEIETDLVTTIPLPDGRTMWADDEALLKPDPQINTLAVKLLGTFGDLIHYVYGTVVIDGGVTEEGDGIALTDEEADALRLRLTELVTQRMPDLVASSWF